jgi:hypothetical protein
MPWKTETDGRLAMKEGNPIFVRERDGKAEEVAVDATQAFSKIDELNDEAAKHRRRAREAETELKNFEGLDATKAREALSKLADLEKKGKLDAGAVDEVRAQLKAEFDQHLEKERAEKASLLAELIADRKFRIFAGSPLFASQDGKSDPVTYLGPEMAMAAFGDRIDFSDPKAPVVKGWDGKPLLSKKNPGEYADPIEGLELLYAADPKRDSYTRGSGMSGTGATGNHSTSSPASYDPKASRAQRVEHIRRHGVQAA